jgi:hypothetical protein
VEAKSLAASGNRTYFARMTKLSCRTTCRGSWAAVSCACLALLICVSSRAENWTQWRGPYFNGSTTEKELPTQWSKTENVDRNTGKVRWQKVVGVGNREKDRNNMASP